jgi:hypothetical protein
VSGDIVERLRNRAETLGWLNEQNGTRERLLDAADEIERLRHELGEAHMNLAMFYPEGGKPGMDGGPS